MPLSERVYCVAITLKMTEWVEQWICIKCYVKLEHPLQKVFGWFRRPQLWASGDWQLHHNNVPTHASHLMYIFGETPNHSSGSAPLHPTFGTLWLLAFPKTKITFGREEISNHRRESGKYDRAVDGDSKEDFAECFECYDIKCYDKHITHIIIFKSWNIHRWKKCCHPHSIDTEFGIQIYIWRSLKFAWKKCSHC